jgi:hypothetical protein
LSPLRKDETHDQESFNSKDPSDIYEGERGPVSHNINSPLTICSMQSINLSTNFQIEMKILCGASRGVERRFISFETSGFNFGCSSK